MNTMQKLTETECRMVAEAAKVTPSYVRMINRNDRSKDSIKGRLVIKLSQQALMERINFLNHLDSILNQTAKEYNQKIAQA